MKTMKVLGLTAFFIISAFSLVACGSQDTAIVKKETVNASNKGFAVLELFTSEGCSSCPPADALLAKIQEEAKGQPVYVLAYHVDYWNRLGWKDIFSNAEYSKRQAQYGDWLNAQIYTPQLVVNGKAEFIGSDEAAIRNAISEQLATNAGTTLAIQAQQDSLNLTIHYQTTATGKGNKLLIALIKKAAESQVKRGENAGRFLSHVQIVGKLQTEPVSATGNGTVTLELPKGFNNQNWEVLALLQNNNNGEILGAAKAAFTNESNTVFSPINANK